MTMVTKEARTTVTVGEPVYIVMVSHRHGEDAWACATEEGAYQSIADYCHMWWGDEHGEWPMQAEPDEDGEEVPVEAPDDDEACIEQYFDVMDGECYEVRQGILNP